MLVGLLEALAPILLGAVAPPPLRRRAVLLYLMETAILPQLLIQLLPVASQIPLQARMPPLRAVSPTPPLLCMQQ